MKQATDEHLNASNAKTLILLSATATGICWGAASIIFTMHTDDVTLWVFLAFFMSGYASGAVFSTSAFLPACAGYFFPTIVPITVWFFSQDIPHTRWMGMLLVVFTVAAWKMARNSHNYLVDSVQKQIALREARLELEANQSKTGALQTMAGGIAHDFNNLFSGMVSTLYLLEKESLSAKGEKYLNIMQKSVDSGSQLSTKMLNYSRASLSNNETISVNQLADERINHVSEVSGAPGLEIALNATGEDLNIFGDRKQLSQVIDALRFNACDSYP